ncbi:MAG: CoA transferase [Pseudonocardia sp.]|nr:CoA transferase [Pseudonocardia sp.]
MTPVPDGAPRPYAGLRVVEMSIAVAGAYTAMLLGDLGADVVKIEPPGGDESRRWQPSIADGEDGCYFVSVNRSKQSLELDIKSPHGRDVLDRLLSDADVLIVNFRPQALDRLGLDVDTVRRRYPRLIYATLTGFGLTGPRANQPAMDLFIQAQSGLMSITGTQDGTPVKVPVPLVDLAAALFAMTGIQSAIRERDSSGRGAHIDVCLQDSLIAFLLYHMTGYLETGAQPRPMGTAHPGIVPYRSFPTQNGQLVLAVFTDRQFASAATVIGRPELAEDPRFARVEHRVRHREHLDAVFTEAFASASTRHWVDAMTEADVPCTPISNLAAVADDPDVRARGAIATLHGPDGRSIRMPASPLIIDGHRVQPRRPPPNLDADADEVMAALGYPVDNGSQIRSTR